MGESTTDPTPSPYAHPTTVPRCPECAGLGYSVDGVAVSGFDLPSGKISLGR